MENVERELRHQWSIALSSNSTLLEKQRDRSHLPANQPPPIPNYALLYHWNRHDLATVIRNVGKLELSYLLGGATVVPGKWSEAVKLALVRRVIELDESLSMDRAPPSPQQKKQRLNFSQQQETEEHNNDKNQQHDDARGRRRHGFWSQQTVVEEL
jgi:hypothetical protein